MPFHSSARRQESDPSQPARAPAVQRCCEARDRSLRQSKAQQDNDIYATRQRAVEAYCGAMPDLSGLENIRDFIACTSYGMVNGLIDLIEGSKFLYAAQVASGVLRKEIPAGVLRKEIKDQKPAAA